MLVLSRRADESAILTLPGGQRAEVRVTEIRGNKVKLGFNFPAEIQINRSEIQSQIDEENQALPGSTVAVNAERRKRMTTNQ